MDGEVLSSALFNTSTNGNDSDTNLELVEKAKELENACNGAFDDLLSPNATISESEPEFDVEYNNAGNFGGQLAKMVADDGYNPTVFRYGAAMRQQELQSTPKDGVLTTRQLVEIAATNRIRIDDHYEGVSPHLNGSTEVLQLREDLAKRDTALRECLRVQQQLEKDLKDLAAENLSVQNQIAVATDTEKELRTRIISLEAEKEILQAQIEHADRQPIHRGFFDQTQQRDQNSSDRISELSAQVERLNEALEREKQSKSTLQAKIGDEEIKRSQMLTEIENLKGALYLEKENSVAALARERELRFRETERLENDLRECREAGRRFEQRCFELEQKQYLFRTISPEENDALIDLACRLTEALEMPSLVLSRDQRGNVCAVKTITDTVKNSLEVIQRIRDDMLQQQVEAEADKTLVSRNDMATSPIKTNKLSTDDQSLRLREYARTVEEYKRALNETRKQALEKMSALSETWQQNCQKVAEQYSTEIDNLKRVLESERQMHTQQLSSIRDQHQTELSSLKSALDSERKNLSEAVASIEVFRSDLKKLQERRVLEYSVTLEDLKKKMEVEREKLILEHVKEIARSKEEHRKNVDKLRDLIGEQAKNFEKIRDDEVKKMRKLHEDEVENLKKDFDDREKLLNGRIKELEKLLSELKEQRSVMRLTREEQVNDENTPAVIQEMKTFIPGILGTCHTGDGGSGQPVIIFPGSFPYISIPTIPLEPLQLVRSVEDPRPTGTNRLEPVLHETEMSKSSAPPSKPFKPRPITSNARLKTRETTTNSLNGVSAGKSTLTSSLTALQRDKKSRLNR